MNLKLYLVVFAVYKGRKFNALTGYIFAKSEADLQKLLEKRYGEIRLKYIEEVLAEEGTILYGACWNTI